MRIYSLNANVRIPLFFLLLILINTAGAESISGTAKITDGDTIEILGVPIRLEGIDAPESGQTCKRPNGGEYNCGKDSLDYLRRLVVKGVHCEGVEYDKYRRLLATCYSDKKNINREMVLNGWAVSFLQYSDAYSEDEQQAKTHRRGIWNGEFVRPHKFRARAWKGAKESSEVMDNGKCVIKGNINSKGKKIYHAPWSRSYKRTKINTSRGERWFCSEDEAMKAGWRTPYKR